MGDDIVVNIVFHMNTDNRVRSEDERTFDMYVIHFEILKLDIYPIGTNVLGIE